MVSERGTPRSRGCTQEGSRIPRLPLAQFLNDLAAAAGVSAGWVGVSIERLPRGILGLELTAQRGSQLAPGRRQGLDARVELDPSLCLQDSSAVGSFADASFAG